MFCNSNQLGEARSGRRGRSFLCQPRTSSKNIHGGSSKECLQSQGLGTNVACSVNFRGWHCLGNGPFHTGSLGIHGSKLGGLFACAGLMKGPIGLFVGLQDQHACGTACTLVMERTRLTGGLRKSHPNDPFAMPIWNGSPALTRRRSRTGHLVSLPIDGEPAVIKARAPLALPTSI